MNDTQADISELDSLSEEEPEGQKKYFRWHFPERYRYAATAFITAGVLAFFWMWLFLSRYNSINIIKQEILRIQDSLNEVNWDIAYDDLRFSVWYPKNLASVKNLKIYSLDEDKPFSLDIPELNIKSGLSGNGKLQFSFDDEIKAETENNQYNLFIPDLKFNLSYDNMFGLRQATLTAKDLIVKGKMKIGSLQLAIMPLAPVSIQQLSPAWEGYMLIEDIKLDKKFKSGLSDSIDKLYINANIVGKPGLDKSYKTSMYDWLEMGGHVDIRTMTLNWKPMAMVGRGSLSFNEKMEPNLHLETSSKALPNMMDMMLKEKWLDSKGVFVSKILLGNKAFKLSPDDKYFAVIAPIDYKENKVMIENITIMKNQPK